MARVFSNFALAMNGIYFYEVTAGAFDSGFYKDVNATVNGIVYPDYIEVDWTSASTGQDLAALFGGQGLQVNALGEVTGGTTTGYFSLIFNGTGAVLWWGIDQISLPAGPLYQAFLTPSASDDASLIAAALAAADLIAGSPYADYLLAYAGADQIIADAGDDTLDGGTGDDTLTGGEGLDRFIILSGTDAIADLGRGGADILGVGAGAAASATLAAAWTATAATSNAGSVSIAANDFGVSLAAAIGGSGWTVSNLGRSLAVALAGSRNADQLLGGGGNDTLDGGLGDDTLTGGAGQDTYMVDSAGDQVIEAAAAGLDTVIATLSFYLPGEIEALILGAGAGFGVGNGLANSITGNAGANLLIGWDGADSLFGGGGEDQLFGVAGDDSLAGEAGIDVLVGGEGADTLDGGAGADALYGEEGNDLLRGGADFVTDIMVGGIGADTLDGGSGQGDYDLMDGAAGDDTYRVDTPADLTFEAAGGGVDTVVADIQGAGYYLYPEVENLILLGVTPYGVGNGLANRLAGSDSANWLLGGAGDDTLDGGAGNDVLFGEEGADLFVLRRGTGGEVIGDFAPGLDRIRLAGLGFADFAAVQATMSEFAGTTAIDLGQGDFVVVLGVARAALTAADFAFA